MRRPRGLVPVVAGALAAGAVFAGTARLSAEDERRNGQPPRNEAPPPAGESPARVRPATDTGAILFLRGTELVRKTLDPGKEEVVARLGTPDVYAAPGSEAIAYVTAGPGDDFAQQPALFLYDAASGRREEVGPGVGPVWQPGGALLAFLEPVEARGCLGESCSGEVRVGVVEATTGRRWTLLDPGRYSILGWAGDRVLVSDFDDTSRIVAVSLDDERTLVDLAPSSFWGASPDGRWVLATRGETVLLPLEEAGLGSGAVPVALGDGDVLLEASWAPDSSRVAAVTGEGGLAGATRAVTFSPDAPHPVEVGGSAGAAGSLLWSGDADRLAFARLPHPRAARLDAMWCTVLATPRCTEALSWKEWVTLLRVD